MLTKLDIENSRSLSNGFLSIIHKEIKYTKHKYMARWPQAKRFEIWEDIRSALFLKKEAVQERLKLEANKP